ncbi:unnamed protein product [Clonostachys rosea f. rosea IK726]|uniref:Uncharacterized protein n=1 Tax=Clonostachys rosea f. rosea IK726 TaxID=1349383 RepID=A0ACA9TH81_BIOOC|nr:unnamed protein product [Clonostachys rosea f. rosea IK726]
MASITTVAVVGGTGDLGSIIVEQLVKSGLFEVTVITRGGKGGQIPAAVKIITVDYESVDNLAEALRGFNAVVSVVAGHLSDLQLRLLDAAIIAGVKRFIPSEFGSDTRLPKVKESPLTSGKIKVAASIQEKVSKGLIEYTSILGGPWIDWMMGSDYCMSIPKRHFTIHDDGNLEFALTTRKAFGDAVVGALKNSEHTKNKVLAIEVIRLTQNRITELTKEAFSGQDIELAHVSTQERYQKGIGKLLSGKFDPSVIADIVCGFVFDPEMNVFPDAEEGNRLLGVQRLTEADFKKILKSGPFVN